MNADNPSAFPMPSKPLPDSYGRAFPESVGDYRGMTLRDYFAAKAMQAFGDVDRHFELQARDAYKMADAMLKVREQ
jgi:hypothetical protein